MRKKLFLILVLTFTFNIVFAQSAVEALVQKLYKLADALFNIGIALATIGIIVGSYLFLSAAGETKKIDQGKSAILWSIVAVILMALSKTIVKFIEKKIK